MSREFGDYIADVLNAALQANEVPLIGPYVERMARDFGVGP